MADRLARVEMGIIGTDRVLCGRLKPEGEAYEQYRAILRKVKQGEACWGPEGVFVPFHAVAWVDIVNYPKEQ